MSIQEFTDKWISNNIDVSDLYGQTVETWIRDFVSLIIRQHHSGASMILYIHYIVKFMEDYREGKVEK